jgi:hypothetical protein
MPSAHDDITVTLTQSVAEELVKRAGYRFVDGCWRSPVSRRRPANLTDALAAALVEIAEGEICLPSIALLRD